MMAYSRGWLICKNEFLGGAYSRGAYLRGAYWEVGAYSRIYGITFLTIHTLLIKTNHMHSLSSERGNDGGK